MTRTMTASRETPQEKSVRLVEDGGVTEVGVNEYTVTSGNKQYRVNDGKCDCDAARWGNPRCSHRLAVELFRSARDQHEREEIGRLRHEIAETERRMAVIEKQRYELSRIEYLRELRHDQEAGLYEEIER